MQKIASWLESHWVTPTYKGWLLLSLAICFFGAATNTMAGWLYALSAIILALLVLNVVTVVRSLRNLHLHRFPIEPVSAGDDLTVKLAVESPTGLAKNLLQITDLVPHVLSEPQGKAIETTANSFQLLYYLKTTRRGIYCWQEVELRTGQPFDLFSCCRSRLVPARAIVYPQVLPLTHCPLIDSLGRDESVRLQSEQIYQTANEGVTRTLRPYRYGDPMRLIHWRTSARFGEFRVRELEVITGGQEIIICLDTVSAWDKEAFEVAVIAAASLYFYASRCQMKVQLWTAESGLIYSNRTVLEVLAGVDTEQPQNYEPPNLPLIWLTQNTSTLETLSAHSHWVFFSADKLIKSSRAGIVINLDSPLDKELQQPLIP